jgi:hypothetical protein
MPGSWQSYPAYLTEADARRELSRLLGRKVDRQVVRTAAENGILPVVRLPAVSPEWKKNRSIGKFYSVADIRKLAAELSRRPTARLIPAL